MRKGGLRWFGYVQRRRVIAAVRKAEDLAISNGKGGQDGFGLTCPHWICGPYTLERT